ncbi:MAG: hypothetical protein JWM95_4391 [Gemmatimonadetes bacterium]|nr:hypothetical protein [Gemmatimonadota bacterium]
MKMAQSWLAAFGFTLALSAGACNCGPEQHAVTVSSRDSLTVTSNGPVRRIGFVNGLTETLVLPSAFQFVFSTIGGSASGEGIALSFSGTDPKSNELVSLTLALPVALRRGDEYVVGATFNVDPGVSSDPQLWGARDLQQSTQAEAAFTVSSYSFPPPQYNTSFRAVTSRGTIRVAERNAGLLELELNLTFVDASGKTVVVTGRVQANSESFPASCN